MEGSKLVDILKAAGGAALSTVMPLKAISTIATLIEAILPESDIDVNVVTGDELLERINALSPEVQAIIFERRFDLERLKVEGENELTQSLADADSSGKTFRPLIALVMAVLLGGAVVGYDILLWKICLVQLRLPLIEELAIPIGVPGLIVLTYFGYLKSERTEIFKALLARSPVGMVSAGAAQKVLDVVSRNAKR